MTLPISLIALAIASFGIGTTEFVIMGLLPEVAQDLHVTIPVAGLLIGGYALGVTFGSPVMAALMARMPRRNTLLLLLSIFTVGNLLCALAPTYGLLMAARLLTALCHGTFFGIGAVVAVQLVPASQRSRAIAIMFSGHSLAQVLGVPAGTALGQWLGWRAAFLAIVPVGLIAIAAILRWLPRVAMVEAGSFGTELRVLRSPAVMLPMLVSTLSSASLFATFTYITPLLQTVAGISPHGVTSVLLMLGIGITVGNLLGGRLADWRQLASIAGLMAALIVVLVLFGSVVASPTGAVVAVALWGLVHFALCAPLQMRVVDGATAAPNLASTLNQSAFNLGNAIGAWVGAQALEAGAGYERLPYLSAGLAAVALGVVVLDAVMTRRRLSLAPA